MTDDSTEKSQKISKVFDDPGSEGMREVFTAFLKGGIVAMKIFPEGPLKRARAQEEKRLRQPNKVEDKHSP